MKVMDNGRKSHGLRILSFFLVLVMLLPAIAVADASEVREIVLFEGNAEVEFEQWGESWEPAVSIGSEKWETSALADPFSVRVEYSGSAEPILVLLSWTGGESWAQINPSYTAYGVAYYPYARIADAYGSDFSNLNAVNIMPSPSEDGLTITKVSLVFSQEENEVPHITYAGTAGKIVRNIHAGWNLGNTLDSYGDWIVQYSAATPSDFETAWGNPETTLQMIESVKRAGFHAIRLPVTWSQHIRDDETYEIDPEWMQRVKQCVSYVLQSGLYCILNVHHDVGGESWLKATQNSVAQNSQKFTALWTQIAQEFADCDSHLLFEGFNEILDDENHWTYPGKDAGEAVNALNQLFVDTVRKTGGNNATRCLVVNTYAAGTSGAQLDDFVLPSDTAENALIVQVHAYLPGSYCTEISEGNNLQSLWTEDDGKTQIDSMLYNLYLHFTSKGIPVIIGEFGAANKDNASDRAEWASYLVLNAQKYGIACFYWDGGGTMEEDSDLGYYKGMSLYDRRADRWVFPEIVRAITGVDVKESAQNARPKNAESVTEIAFATFAQSLTVDMQLYRARVQRVADIAAMP